MKNYFTLLDKVLHKELRPWLEANNPDEKFASMISGIKNVEPTFQPKYEINFERPFNYKTKYYSKLILNEKINTINHLLDALHEDDSIQLLKYRLNETLNKKLKTKIQDIGKIIKDQQFELSYINPRKTTFDIDREHKANTFVIQLLKTSLIHIYLEIQEEFNDWIQDELVIEDFFSQLLFEPIPDKFYISKIPNIEVETSKPDAQEEIPTYGEISLDSFTYIKFDKNPDNLNDLCDSLKKHGFIDQKTTTSNFKKVFSGNPITVPIVWTGNPSEFAYFIKLIHNQYRLVADLKQKQWKVAVQCFVKEDSTQFHPSVRKLQRPASTGDKLDRIVDHLL